MEDYPLLDLFWTSLMIMFMIMWIWIVIATFMDNFRRTDHGGWAKAGWTVLLVFLPVIGVFAYMIARPRPTPEEVAMLGLARPVAPSSIARPSTTQEIGAARELLETGAIDQSEYEQIKRRALAS